MEKINLLSVISDISSELTGKDVGKTMKVLVESKSEQDDSLVTGRLSNNILVHFKGDESLIGQIIDVKLNEAKGFYYIGEMA